MSLTTRPPTPAPAHDLSDAEFAELDDLLATTPEPFEPLDVVMLDGYLCGVIVQPVLLEPPTWLAHIFDFEGRPLPDDVDASWLARTTHLVMRRHGALNRSLVEHGWFDPLILEPEGDEDGTDDNDDDAAAAAAAAAAELHPEDKGRVEHAAAPDVDREAGTEGDADPGTEGDADPGTQVDDPAERSAGSDDAAPRASASPAGPASAADDPAASLGPVSQALMPWVGGFQHAAATFPDLEELPDEAVMNSLARLYRHLPAETEEERELVATLEREHPLADLDEAIEDMVGAVADLFELTNEQRYKVDTVRRETPKVGRNDPCPCGSGKKYKQCHGAA